MKTLFAFVSGVVAATSFASISFAQLAPPPGPVAPSKVSIELVDGRIPVGPMTTPGDVDSLYVISSPGSYYLTEDVFGGGRHGVKITSVNVDLDLNGYRIRATLGGSPRHGVFVSTGAFAEVKIRNGFIRDCTGSGVHATGSLVYIEDVFFARNDLTAIVLEAAYYEIIRCRFWFNGNDVPDGTACEIDCRNQIGAIRGCSVGGGRTDILVSVATNATVIDNVFQHSFGDDALVAGFDTVIDSNTFVEGDIRLTGSDNLVVRNRFFNGQIDPAPAGNAVGPIVTPADIATSSNPHANYVP